MKELEASLTELTRDGFDELAVARGEATRLRQALTATKARVLGLRDSLTAVAEEVDRSLSSIGQETTVSAPAIEGNDVALLPEADRYGVSGAQTRVLGEAATITSSGSQEGLQNAAQLDSDGPYEPPRHEHRSNPCDLVSVEDGLAVDLAAPASMRDLQTQRTDYGEYDYLHWHFAPGMEPGTKAFPTLLPADTPEEQAEIPALALPFPPGGIKFPSVFSAHIGIIEFFAKKSSAYAHRTEIGGAEAYVRPGS